MVIKIRENPYPFWFWLFLVVIIITLVIGMQSWIRETFTAVPRGPFTEVTNRDFSLFLWQHPEYMRVNATTKAGYLTGFQDEGSIKKGSADQYVVVLPEVLFRYHTWKRQVKSEFPSRRIDGREFLEFLQQVSEWDPQNWPAAPVAYATMVDKLPNIDDLQNLPKETLPVDVQLAFIGWKNYFKEQKAIQETTPTYAQMQSFLAQYPHYARNYWKNITSDQYLRTLALGNFSSDHIIPNEELALFLKIALYNFLAKTKPSS